MKLLFDSFWRALAYCLRPRVIFLSLLPLLLVIVVTLGLGYFFWDSALNQVQRLLASSFFAQHGWAWVDNIGWGPIKSVLAPLIVIFSVTPLIVIACLLAVAMLMTPVLVQLVAQRRFPALVAQGGASFWQSVLWSLVSTLLALLALVASVPLWFVPPLILVVPPLIWGWLGSRVLAFDALAEHASARERYTIFRRHRLQFLGMGVLIGYLGAAPSLVWTSGALFAAAFVLLVPLAIWIYTLVFVFSSLWFAHYCLAALTLLRAQTQEPAPPL